MSRRRRRAEIWEEILAIWTGGQISREAGQVCHIKAMLVVLLSTLVWSVSQSIGQSVEFQSSVASRLAFLFKQKLILTIMIILKVWRRIFVALLMPTLWFFLSVGIFHMLVDHLGTWSLSDFPPPSPTLSSPFISNLRKSEPSHFGLFAAFSLVKRMLLICAGTEQNPGPQTSTEVENWEFEGVEDSMKTYNPTRKVCGVCGVGTVTAVSRSSEKGEMMVYTRSGIVKARHLEFRCNSRATNCRALHGHGYFKHKGKKIFEADALKNKILVVSSQTAFEIEYLVEISYTVEINSDNFEGLAKLYNRMHNHRLPTATTAKREDLCRKRMTDAYMTYVYLEFAQRYGIRNYQVVDANIDETILKHKTEKMNKFRERWAVNHRCETPGCGWCLTIDGGLKPHRQLCGAKMSGIRVFPAAGIKIFTGCRVRKNKNFPVGRLFTQKLSVKST